MHGRIFRLCWWMWGIFGINGRSVKALGVKCERGKLRGTNSWEMKRHVLLEEEINSRIREINDNLSQEKPRVLIEIP
jgi:hypothetical protein